MTRFWPAGVLIDVVSDALDTPTAVRWQGQSHRVETIATRWRIKQRWWHTQIWREYFTIATRSGLLLTIYHDLPRAGWYLQCLYD
jgi:hypothetical protein